MVNIDFRTVFVECFANGDDKTNRRGPVGKLSLKCESFNLQGGAPYQNLGEERTEECGGDNVNFSACTGDLFDQSCLFGGLFCQVWRRRYHSFAWISHHGSFIIFNT